MNKIIQGNKGFKKFQKLKQFGIKQKLDKNVSSQFFL